MASEDDHVAAHALTAVISTPAIQKPPTRTISSLPVELLCHLMPFIPFSGPQWNNLQLVCRSWKETAISHSVIKDTYRLQFTSLYWLRQPACSSIAELVNAKVADENNYAMAWDAFFPYNDNTSPQRFETMRLALMLLEYTSDISRHLADSCLTRRYEYTMRFFEHTCSSNVLKIIKESLDILYESLDDKYHIFDQVKACAKRANISLIPESSTSGQCLRAWDCLFMLFWPMAELRGSSPLDSDSAVKSFFRLVYRLIMRENGHVGPLLQAVPGSDLEIEFGDHYPDEFLVRQTLAKSKLQGRSRAMTASMSEVYTRTLMIGTSDTFSRKVLSVWKVKYLKAYGASMRQQLKLTEESHSCPNKATTHGV